MKSAGWREKLNQDHRYAALSLIIAFVILQIAIVCGLSPPHVHQKIESQFNLSNVFVYPILKDFLWFLFSQFLLNTAWFFSLVFSTKGFCYLIKLNARQTTTLTIAFWLMQVVFFIYANTLYFPHSKFAVLTIQEHYFSSVYWTVKLLGLLNVLLLFIGWFGFFWHQSYRLKIWIAIIALFLLGAFLTLNQAIKQEVYHPSQEPNIIIFSFDSLRPDYLKTYGNAHTDTPHIDAWLSDAAIFPNAITPLARTFPAWSSLLTSLYPRESGAIFNLKDFSGIKTPHSLAWDLKHLGYQTFYASDERRFSNIDEDFGFDHIIGPPVGLNDFILGALNDFPLSNLFINGTIGQWLFPFNHANRAAASTYQPETFVELFKKKFHPQTQKPFFLGMHLCLAHWPFYWAEKHLSTKRIVSSRHSRIDAYRESIAKMDDQFAQLLAFMNEKHLLNHSLIFMISDHGENLGRVGERLSLMHLYDPSLPRKDLPTISLDEKGYGHGLDVLSPSALQIVFAAKGKGIHPYTHSTPVSLIDIKPTILDWVNTQSRSKMSGYSLKPLLLNTHSQLPNRPFFLESGLSLPELNQEDPDIAKIMKETLNLYRVNPNNGRLLLKTEKMPTLVKRKQQGMLFKDWLIAKIPSYTSAGTDRYVIFNLTSGKWTDHLGGSFAKDAPLDTMQQYWQHFFNERLPTEK